MTWTYSGNPSSTDKDAVRFRVGDTDSSDQQLSDEEIAYLLDTEGSVDDAAIKACYSLIAKFSRKIDQSVGAVKYSYDQLVKHYQELAKKLESESSDTIQAYSGGISKSDKETREQNDDMVVPDFVKDLHDIEPLDQESRLLGSQ